MNKVLESQDLVVNSEDILCLVMGSILFYQAFCVCVVFFSYLRNELNFWNVHGIMNTSGFLPEARSIHDSMNRAKIEFIFYINILS